MPVKPKLPNWRVRYLGPEDADERLFAMALTHGQEFAPSLALEWATEGLRPRNTRVALVWADPQGMAEEGYGFVSLDGREMVDDPWYRGDPFGDSYLRTSFDLNSEFGMTTPLTARSAEIRELLHSLSPTFTLALHETVGSERSSFFWGGCGLLIIESYLTAPEDWDLLPGIITGTGGIEPILNPLRYLQEMVADWTRGVLRRPIYRRLQRSLSSNPHYRLISDIVEEYKRLDGYLCGAPWETFLDGWYKNSMCGPGRINRSLWTGATSWLTLGSYATWKFGCPSVTLESFDPIRAGTWGLEERGDQHFKFLQATISILEKRCEQS